MAQKADPAATAMARAPLAIVLFAGTGLAIFVALAAWIAIDAYRGALERARVSANAGAQVVSANVSLLMQSTEQALRRIDAGIGSDLGSNGVEVQPLSRYVEDLPPGVFASVLDAGGTVRLTSLDTLAPLNASDRSYFKAVRDGQMFAVSELLTSRSSGEAVFVVAKRLERNNSFAGAAVITVPANYMDTFREPLGLGPQSTVGLIRADGMLVTRSPVPKEATDLSGYVLFTDYLVKEDFGTYEAVSPTDGVERVVSYRRVPGFPLVAVASIARQEAFVAFNQTMTMLAVLLLPALGGYVALAWRATKTQSELSISLAQNQLLLREIHHRVKNNLQQVAAIIALQRIERSVRDDVMRKIAAMSALHEHMYRSDAYGALAAEAFFPPLLDAVAASFAEPLRVTFETDPIVVDRDQALPLALISAEVITNSAKHAFDEGDRRVVAVGLRRLEGGQALLTIRDGGRGYDGSSSATGTGSRLINALAEQLQGECRYVNAEGTVFELHFPLKPDIEA